MLSVFACLICFTVIGACTANKVIVYSDEGGGKEAKALWPDRHLKNRFAHYWDLRLKGRSDKTFAMEAPHVQFILPQKRYDTYIKNLAVNELIHTEILNISKTDQYLYEIEFNLHLLVRDQNQKQFFYRERWVNVEDKWYHVLQDRLIFPQLTFKDSFVNKSN
jgi:hypothetical protein